MAFKLKSGNKISFKNMGSSPAKTSGHTAPAADGHQHLTNEQSLAAANRRKEEGISKRMSKYNIDKKKATELWTKQNPPLPQPKSPAKTHKPGHKEVDYDKRKEELLNQGFTQKDADKMIESGAVTGKVDVESYKDRMERLSKKYNKSPKEVNKILKSKDYKEGRIKIHSPNKQMAKQKVDPDAPGTPGEPGYEPPVRYEDLDEAGKKLWHKVRAKKTGTGFMKPPYKDTVKLQKSGVPYEKRQGYHGFKDFDSILSKPKK